jgi:acyl-CoA reductase-like NAD-dependent aldehyde dehydrogenase
MTTSVESLQTKVAAQSAPVESFPIYVSGQFKTTHRTLDVISPYSGEVVYQTYLAGDQEYEQAVQAAEKVREDMRKLPIFQRFKILNEISEGIAKYREDVAKIMSREAAKPLKAAHAEADRAAQTFLIAAEEAKRLPGEVMRLDWTPAAQNKEAIIKYFPVGLVAGISPFNFPLNLVAHKIAPAIAAGCPIVLKPASKAPISALLLAKIIDQTTLPKGAVSILPMDRDTGNKLVNDERFALLSFTGSPEVGWEMKKNAGKKKVVLELGGNAGLIIEKDADLQKAVTKSVVGAFGNTGQSCIHTQRIFVEASVFDEFTRRFQAEAQKLTVGDPEDEATDVSAMIDDKNARRIEQWMDEAKQAGAKVLLGGHRTGTVYAPTILTNTRPDMKVCALEAFAPIVVVERFTRFEEAVAAINHSNFGLQAGVFTNDYKKIHYAFENLEVGGVTINEVPTYRADQMPYGGVKDSGLGREGPKYAILDLMEPRILILDHT